LKIFKSIKKNYKRIFQRNKKEDTIHLRAIEYGMRFHSGFMYEYFRKHYERRDSDWRVVNEFFNEAYNNKNGLSSRVTPFVLLEKMGNGNCDQSKYILSYEAYFNYLAYRNSKISNRIAIFALSITVLFSMVSVLNVYKNNRQFDTNDRINKTEYRKDILNKDRTRFERKCKVRF